RAAGRGGARLTGTPRPCRVAGQGRQACRSGRDDTRARGPSPEASGLQEASVATAMYEDRRADRPARTPPAVAARHGTDSATHGGTAGPMAMGDTRGPDPRRAGSASWRDRPEDVPRRDETRRCAARPARAGAAPRASERVAAASGPPGGVQVQ